jgi:quercetin dioxygenase-like cupin family protein
MVLRLALTLTFAISLTAAAGTQAPALPPGVTASPVLDNGTVGVVHMQLSPGAREQPHTHSYPLLVVLLSRGELEMHNGKSHTKTTRHAGDVEFVGKGVPHHAANVGATPMDALVLSIKPDRVRVGETLLSQATPGVTRTSIVDNAEVTVLRFEFEADVREALHTHAYDLMIVPIMPARIDLQIGDRKQMRSIAAGEAIFIRRSVPHAVANIGAASFRALAVAFK